MKTKLLNKISWDLRIVYNHIDKKYYLEKFDYYWERIFTSKKIKKVIKKKHKKMTERLYDRGYFKPLR